MSCPAILVHHGDQDYLQIAIDSIGQFYPTHLIGNESNQGFSQSWVSSDELDSELAGRFQSAFKNMSSNSAEFEERCFLRYYWMLEFIQRNDIDRFIHFDSDVIALATVPEEISNCPYLALSIPEDQSNKRWSVSPHVACWTKQALVDFCQYVIDAYEQNDPRLEEKYEHHLQHNLSGGVCDMTLLYLFCVDKGIDQFTNASRCNPIIGFNLNNCDGYSRNEFDEFMGVKRMSTVNGRLCYFRNGVPENVATIHAQGKAKVLMPKIARGQYRLASWGLIALVVVRKFRDVVSKITKANSQRSK